MTFNLLFDNGIISKWKKTVCSISTGKLLQHENVCLIVPIYIWWNHAHKVNVMIYPHKSYNKNIVGFLLLRKGKIFGLRTKYYK